MSYPPAQKTATSKAAAASVAGIAPTQELRVLRAIHDAGLKGLNRDEVEQAVRIRTPAACARMNTLAEKGHIAFIPGGDRPGASGRMQRVYRSTSLGCSALGEPDRNAPAGPGEWRCRACGDLKSEMRDKARIAPLSLRQRRIMTCCSACAG